MSNEMTDARALADSWRRIAAGDRRDGDEFTANRVEACADALDELARLRGEAAQCGACGGSGFIDHNLGAGIGRITEDEFCPECEGDTKRPNAAQGEQQAVAWPNGCRSDPALCIHTFGTDPQLCLRCGWDYREYGEPPSADDWQQAAPACPEGWQPCTPDYVAKHGDCATAPRVSFRGDVRSHYHPIRGDAAPAPVAGDAVVKLAKELATEWRHDADNAYGLHAGYRKALREAAGQLETRMDFALAQDRASQGIR